MLLFNFFFKVSIGSLEKLQSSKILLLCLPFLPAFSSIFLPLEYSYLSITQNANIIVLKKAGNRNTIYQHLQVQKFCHHSFRKQAVWFIMWHFTLWFPPNDLVEIGIHMYLSTVIKITLNKRYWHSGWLMYTIILPRLTGLFHWPSTWWFGGEERNKDSEWKKEIFLSHFASYIRFQNLFFLSQLPTSRTDWVLCCR